MDNKSYEPEEAMPLPDKEKLAMDFTESDSDIPDNRSLMQKFQEYPKCVFFIFGNEFCERFSYYGMQTVLTIYFLNILKYSDTQATVFFNGWGAACYFMPIFGCILADGYIGKFYTILSVSLIYACGNIILAVAATFPTGHKAHPAMDIAGLVIIAIGTGGIKPCVSAFGGDQFKQGQEKWLETFFSVFYFSINAGSCISTFLTPIFRTRHCNGQDSCFPLAFGVPAALMVISCIFFIFGSFWYRKLPPKENILGKAGIVTAKALINKPKGPKRSHWLEHYLDTHHCETDPLCQELGYCDKALFTKDLAAVYRLLIMYLPMPFFWALYNQQGSMWVIQGTQMNGKLGKANILPDQLQVINPILIMAFIPLFSGIIYPIVEKCYKLTSLRKMAIGGMLAAVSYVVMGFVQLAVNKTLPVIPAHGTARFSFINYAPCDVNVHASLMSSLGNASPMLNRTIMAGFGEKYVYNYTLPSSKDGEKWYLDLKLSENGTTGCTLPQTGIGMYPDNSTAISSRGAYYVPINIHGIGMYPEPLQKPQNGEGENIYIFNFMIPGYPNYTNTVMYLCKPKTTAELNDTKHGCNNTKPSDTFQHVHFNSFNVSDPVKKFGILQPGKWYAYLPTSKTGKPNQSDPVNWANYPSFSFSNTTQGALQGLSIVGDSTETDHFNVSIYTFSPENKINILWQMPQYLIVTAAEILFSITGLEFSYSQAPMSMKSVLQAAWLIAVAVGNVIIIIITAAQIFENQAYVFFLYAGIMFVVMVIFILMSYFYYEYVFYIQEDDDDKEKKENLKKD